MTRRLSTWLFLLAAGCAPGRGAVLVDVDAQPSVSGVHSLRIVATVTGAVSQPAVLALPGAPVSIPPRATFSLAFDKARKGPLSVHVDALDASGAVLASGCGGGMIAPSDQTEVAVVLVPLGAGGGDMAGPVDAGAPPDQTSAADMAVAADMAAPPDLTTPDDLAVEPDMTTPDDLSGAD